MDTKALLFGLIGFFLGGLLVSVAATLQDTAAQQAGDSSKTQMVKETHR